MATSAKKLDLDLNDAREALKMLSRCMVWQETPQGHDFWQSAYDALLQLVLEHGGSTGVRCSCNDFPGADEFCTAHKSISFPRSDQRDRFEDAAFALGVMKTEPPEETRSAPDNSGLCPVCGWPAGHCNVGCTASSHQRIKIGDRVRLAIGTNTMLPTEGWTVYKLPSPEWRSYGVKHDNGGDMSINAEYVVPV